MSTYYAIGQFGWPTLDPSLPPNKIYFWNDELFLTKEEAEQALVIHELSSSAVYKIERVPNTTYVHKGRDHIFARISDIPETLTTQ